MTLESRLAASVTATDKNSYYRLLATPALKVKRDFHHWLLSALVFGTVAIAGCSNLTKEPEANAQSQQGDSRQGVTPVEVAIAERDQLREEPEYTGTTAPVQEVSLRAQVEGQVRNLNVDVGDRVTQGQIVGQLDDDILKTALNSSQAELASLKAEVAQAKTQVSNAKAQVEQARLELQQAQSDSARQQQLVRQGAIAQQTAQQARTTAKTTAQAFRAAQEQVRTQQEAVNAAQAQVNAQQAVVAQAQEQLSYTTLKSPITGVVTQRVTEEGNLLQPNGEVFKLGDFSRVEVDVEVSDKQLSKIRTGQLVTVRLDAFANQTFQGQVSRISPAADPTARLVPIEVVIPNRNGKIGSGLLARVSFEDDASEKVVVPETAVSQQQEQGLKTGNKVRERQGENTSQNAQSLRAAEKAKTPNSQGTVFVVTGKEGGQATVSARAVTLGETANGKVEVLSGLKPGEQFVARSGKQLKNGETVRLSIISETAQQRGQQ